MSNNYVVYIHISPSNKRYVGITSQEPKRRWQNGRGYYKNIHFTNAINKYGWDNFQHIIIARGLDKETAKWLEIELIRELDLKNEDKGYNITDGGDTSVPCSKETKEIISKTNSKSVICLTTKRIFSSVKKANEFYNIINVSKCCNNTQNSCGELEDGSKLIWKRINYEHNKSYRVIGSIKDSYNPNYNKYSNIKSFHYLNNNSMSQEQRDKISKTRIESGIAIGENNPRATKVICVTTGKIFNTLKEGAEFYNCCRQEISHCCKGYRTKKGKKVKVESCGKLEDGTPLVWKYLKDYLIEQEQNNNNNN